MYEKNKYENRKMNIYSSQRSALLLTSKGITKRYGINHCCTLFTI